MRHARTPKFQLSGPTVHSYTVIWVHNGAVEELQEEAIHMWDIKQNYTKVNKSNLFDKFQLLIQNKQVPCLNYL